MTRALLLVQVVSTIAMCGVIWIVQLVHYPLFARVGEQAWLAYHHDHMRLITYVVGPLMLAEIATALWMVADAPAGVPLWARWLGLGLVGVAWGVTALFSVPQHNALGSGLDVGAVSALVASNWLRTLAWTARAALMAYILYLLLPAD